MLKNELCPNCRTGQKMYKLDPKEPICPYLYYYMGRKCLYYEPFIKKNILWKLCKKLKAVKVKKL